MIEVTNDNLSVPTSGLFVVDFWAEWCGPCKRLMPILESVSSSRGDITFAKVDTEKNQKLTAEMGITALPTLVIFKDGQKVSKLIGLQTVDSLNQALDKINLIKEAL